MPAWCVHSVVLVPCASLCFSTRQVVPPGTAVLQSERPPVGDQCMYPQHNYDFGNQILQLRTRVALTQSALAKQLGVHRRSVQNWETGVTYPKADMLQRLIAVFVRALAFTAGN